MKVCETLTFINEIRSVNLKDRLKFIMKYENIHARPLASKIVKFSFTAYIVAYIECTWKNPWILNFLEMEKEIVKIIRSIDNFKLHVYTPVDQKINNKVFIFYHFQT